MYPLSPSRTLWAWLPAPGRGGLVVDTRLAYDPPPPGIAVLRAPLSALRRAVLFGLLVDEVRPMSWDEELAACSRRCAASDAPLAPGESYYSAVLPENGQLVRRDFAADAWQGPPEEAIAWWKATAPQALAAPRLAPEDMLLQLFERLAGSPDERELRYLLGLLLLRKRLLRFVESRQDPDGAEWWGMEALRTETQYELLVAAPDPERAAALQQRLLDLVYGSSPNAPSTAVAMQHAKEAA